MLSSVEGEKNTKIKRINKGLKDLTRGLRFFGWRAFKQTSAEFANWRSVYVHAYVQVCVCACALLMELQTFKHTNTVAAVITRRLTTSRRSAALCDEREANNFISFINICVLTSQLIGCYGYCVLTLTLTHRLWCEKMQVGLDFISVSRETVKQSGGGGGGGCRGAGGSGSEPMRWRHEGMDTCRAPLKYALFNSHGDSLSKTRCGLSAEASQ